jgi:hypothetical protein
MRLSPSLLDTSRGLLTAPGDFYATLTAHGLYNSRRFVLRLSPEVHRKLSTIPGGFRIATDIDWDTAQAWSTYLHETIHWWQHVGSTVGLLLSLSYPAQALANYNQLLQLLKDIGPKKSLRLYLEGTPKERGLTSPTRIATAVVNNYYDIEFFRILTTNPDLTRKVVGDPYFDCVGHSFRIAYRKILYILQSTFDEGYQFLPNPSTWESEFDKLRTNKIEGYFHGSNVDLCPIGARHIFEGQARFSQLQYLHFGSNGRLTWEDAHALGMLHGVYLQAFEEFLRLAELDWPPTIDDPLVGLFLLICDIACNPCEGFPKALISPKTFIYDVDPGKRFAFLCRAIPLLCRDVTGLVRTYSRDEYIEASDKLTRALLLFHPLAGCAELMRWAHESEQIRALTSQHQSFTYDEKNFAVQLLFAHHLAFAKDKIARPEFFCWPGAWLAGDRCTSDAGELFLRHTARFVDKADDETIYPTIPSGADEAKIYSAFQKFYDHHVGYDLTRQWIIASGPFHYDYRWLQPAATHRQKAWADSTFSKIYGVGPDEFELL